MPKPKRVNQSKEDITKRLKEVEKAKVHRKFVRDALFPALCESTESIQDADTFLQSFSSMIMESHLQLMKEKLFKEFKLEDKLDKTSPKYEAICKMIHLFDEMNCRDAQAIIDGMKDELRMFYRDEMKERKLESLKTKWLAD